MKNNNRLIRTMADLAIRNNRRFPLWATADEQLSVDSICGSGIRYLDRLTRNNREGSLIGIAGKQRSGKYRYFSI